MATLQEDMCAYFVGKGLLEEFGIDCFEDFVPDEPNNVVVLYEYGGDSINPYTDVVHRSLQVLVRNVIQDDAKALANSLHKALQSDNLLVQFTPERFGQVYLRDMPIKLKTDENGRTYYCFNVGITTTMD